MRWINLLRYRPPAYEMQGILRLNNIHLLREAFESEKQHVKKVIEVALRDKARRIVEEANQA